VAALAVLHDQRDDFLDAVEDALIVDIDGQINILIAVGIQFFFGMPMPALFTRTWILPNMASASMAAFA
jgi:hypothetical protein